MTLISRRVSLALGLAFTAVSCSENAPPKTATLPNEMSLITQPPGSEQAVVTSSPGALPTVPPPPGVSPLVPNAPVPAAAPAVAPAPVVAVAPPKRVIPKEDVVVPPPDARYTLFIASFDGPNHVDGAKAAREQLKSATNSNKFYVVHEDAKSVIYYGFYRDIDSKTKYGKQAQADKASLAALKTSAGESPLATIYFKSVDAAAPDAPAEWDLSKLSRSPQKYWSLQIAAYTADGRAENPGDASDRKSAAVESVRDLRAHGIEAYFYHGESVSSVCVGVWPENAVRRQSGGNPAGNAGTRNPDDRLLVGELPANLKSVKTIDGERVKTLTPKLEVLDPAMLSVMRQFPTHALNGNDMMRTYGKGKAQFTQADPSVLVLVPEAKIAMPTGMPTDAELMNLQLNAGAGISAPGQRGPGKLRSVGE